MPSFIAISETKLSDSNSNISIPDKDSSASLHKQVPVVLEFISIMIINLFEDGILNLILRVLKLASLKFQENKKTNNWLFTDIHRINLTTFMNF